MDEMAVNAKRSTSLKPTLMLIGENDTIVTNNANYVKERLELSWQVITVGGHNGLMAVNLMLVFVPGVRLLTV